MITLLSSRKVFKPLFPKNKIFPAINFSNPRPSPTSVAECVIDSCASEVNLTGTDLPGITQGGNTFDITGIYVRLGVYNRRPKYKKGDLDMFFSTSNHWVITEAGRVEKSFSRSKGTISGLGTRVRYKPV